MGHQITAAELTPLSPSTPVEILGYAANRPSRNLAYDTLNGGLVVTMRGLRKRSGTLRLLYLDASDAFDAVNLHNFKTVFTLSTDAQQLVDMDYVIAEGGAVGIELDPETRAAWVVTIPFEEVIA